MASVDRQCVSKNVKSFLQRALILIYKILTWHDDGMSAGASRGTRGARILFGIKNSPFTLSQLFIYLETVCVLDAKMQLAHKKFYSPHTGWLCLRSVCVLAGIYEQTFLIQLQPTDPGCEDSLLSGVCSLQVKKVQYSFTSISPSLLYLSLCVSVCFCVLKHGLWI